MGVSNDTAPSGLNDINSMKSIKLDVSVVCSVYVFMCYYVIGIRALLDIILSFLTTY